MELTNTKVNRNPRILLYQIGFLIFLVVYFTGCGKNE